MAGLLNGTDKLVEEHFRPPLARIARHICKGLHLGWRPQRDTMDFFLRLPRKFNAVADHLANIALQEKRSWSSPEEDCIRLDVNSANPFLFF